MTTTGSIQTADGLTLYTVSQLPANDPKAAIFLVHGYGEHIGRYQHVIDHLSRQGYAAYGLDHRGHGKSGGERVYFENLAQLADDYHLFFDHARQNHPGKKVFLLGHSLGSLVALKFALRYQNDLAGLILSGAAIKADEPVPGLLVSVGTFLAGVLPHLRLTPLATSFDVLSRDPQIVAAYKNDPLVDPKGVRARTGLAMIQGARELRGEVGALRLPLLLMHGAADQIAPPVGTGYIHEQAASSDKTVQVYPEMRHEIFNEIDRERVLDDLVSWLDAH